MERNYFDSKRERKLIHKIIEVSAWSAVQKLFTKILAETGDQLGSVKNSKGSS